MLFSFLLQNIADEAESFSVLKMRTTVRSVIGTLVPANASEVAVLCGSTFSLVAHSTLAIKDFYTKYASFKVEKAFRVQCLPQKLFSVSNAKVIVL